MGRGGAFSWWGGGGARAVRPIVAAFRRWNGSIRQGAMRRFLAWWMGVIAWSLSSFATAGPTGLINMPDARFNPDGTLRFGMAYVAPYFDLSANATLLPWLETNLAVTRISGVAGFPTQTSAGFGSAYGAYKDKNA